MDLQLKVSNVLTETTRPPKLIFEFQRTNVYKPFTIGHIHNQSTSFWT
jgi:hypothetical protein